MTSLRPLWAIFGIVLLGPALARAQSSFQQIVHMPPFVVEDTRIEPPYLYCELPGLRVLSLISERDTRAIIRGIQERGRLYSVLVPDEFHVGRPFTTLLLKPASEGIPTPFAAHQKTKERALPRTMRSGAVQAWQFDTASRYVMHSPKLLKWGIGRGLYSPDHTRRGDLSWRLPVWVTLMLNDMMRAEPTADGGTQRVKFSRQSVRVFFPARNMNPPQFWKYIPIGEAFPSPEEAFDHSLNHEADLRGRYPLLPSFVIWALMNPGEPGRAAGFWRLVGRSAVEPVTAKLFQECMGQSFDQVKLSMEHEWRTRVTHGREIGSTWDNGGITAEFALMAFSDKEEPTIRTATTVERIRLLTDWELTAAFYVGRGANEYVEYTRANLSRCANRLELYLKNVERNPEFVGLLGLCRLEQGDRKAARSLLVEADEKQVDRPRVQYELARFELSDARGEKVFSDSGRISDAAAERILSRLQRIRSVMRSSHELYQFAFVVLGQCSDAILQKHAPAWIDEACTRIPRANYKNTDAAPILQRLPQVTTN